MRIMHDFYSTAIAKLEGSIDEEEDDDKANEAIVKLGEYTLVMQKKGVDDMDQRKSRLASLEVERD